MDKIPPYVPVCRTAAAGTETLGGAATIVSMINKVEPVLEERPRAIQRNLSTKSLLSWCIVQFGEFDNGSGRRQRHVAFIVVFFAFDDRLTFP